MAYFTSEGGRYFANFPSGVKREINLVLDPTQGSNILGLGYVDEGGVSHPIPIRLKGVDGGERLAADFPTINPESPDAPFFVLDGDGHLADG
jgi:hypothetical protein